LETFLASLHLSDFKTEIWAHCPVPVPLAFSRVGPNALNLRKISLVHIVSPAPISIGINSSRGQEESKILNSARRIRSEGRNDRRGLFLSFYEGFKVYRHGNTGFGRLGITAAPFRDARDSPFQDARSRLAFDVPHRS
jgi:hypothetical protein